MSHHKHNFSEELLYENIAKAMKGKENFIANRGSVFPHGSIGDATLNLPEQNTSDDDLQKYLATLPKTFDEWIK